MHEQSVSQRPERIGWRRLSHKSRDKCLVSPSTAARFLQQVLNGQGAGLNEDGEIGRLTLAAANACEDIARAVTAYAEIYEAYYRNLAGFSTFGRGWLNRLADVKANALAWVAERPARPPVQPSPAPQLPPWVEAIAAAIITAIKDRNLMPAEPAKPAPAPAPTPAITIDPKLLQPLVSAVIPILLQLGPALLRAIGGARSTAAGPQPSSGLVEIFIAVINAFSGQKVVTTAQPASDTTGLGASIMGWVAYVMGVLGGGVGAPIGDKATLTGQIITTLLGGVTALAGSACCCASVAGSSPPPHRRAGDPVRWVWLALIGAFVAGFAVFETIALNEPDGLTLSRLIYDADQAWPLVGVGVGILLCHFFWQWDPRLPERSGESANSKLKSPNSEENDHEILRDEPEDHGDRRADDRCGRGGAVGRERRRCRHVP